MKISEIINVNSISLNLIAENKKDIIEQMMLLAWKSGKVLDIEEALKEVFEREKIMSTGVGKGIALPHAKTKAITDAIGALAILSVPIDYESLDEEPVNIVFLLLGMENNVGNHLRLLSKISRLLNNDIIREQIIQSKNAGSIMELLKSLEEDD